jgi:UDPglucose--hexose-1-phosphate uridylyltransferase
MPEITPHAGLWEQRWHPLRGEWVVYAAHRNTRPWVGAAEEVPRELPVYDEHCYLCPGNTRVGGAVNPHYQDVFVFDNDHPVVGPDAPEVADPGLEDLYWRRRADGVARVVCYDPRHNVSLADITQDRATRVLAEWRSQVRELGAAPGIDYVLLFENKGEIVGTSCPHPHCQLYATNFVFRSIERELEAVQQYREDAGRNLFEAILAAELEEGTRVVAGNEHAVAFVPFFARYAYEVWIFPRRRHATLTSLSDEELQGLAGLYRQLNRQYDALYQMSFPYVMTLCQAPLDGGDYADYHLHLVFLPPLRQPGLRKFAAGPEIGGGNFMADTMPEEKAAELRRAAVAGGEEGA